MEQDIEGSRSLIFAIFQCSILDVLRCPDAKKDFYGKYRVGSNAEKSLDAQLFLSKDSKVFNIYCELLGLDVEFCEKKIWKTINDLKKKSKKLRRTVIELSKLSMPGCSNY